MAAEAAGGGSAFGHQNAAAGAHAVGAHAVEAFDFCHAHAGFSGNAGKAGGGKRCVNIPREQGVGAGVAVVFLESGRSRYRQQQLAVVFRNKYGRAVGRIQREKFALADVG